MNIGMLSWFLFQERGGVQTSTKELSEAMLARGHNITVFYKKGRHEYPTYDFSKEISFIELNVDEKETSYDLIQNEKNKIIYSNIDILITLGAIKPLSWFPYFLYKTGIPLLISERIPKLEIDEIIGLYEHHACLAAADHIHVLMEEFREAYPSFLKNKITVIPNPAPIATQTIKSNKKNRYVLMALGRHEDKQKNFSMLIEAFSLIADKFPSWDLVLGGEGKDSKSYKKLAATLGLKKRVFFPGLITDTASFYPTADLFCIPSRFEGFGRVTTEAQSFGLPVVGFADCPGTNEIIIHEENGLLAPDFTPESLSECLSLLMDAPALRREMAERTVSSLERYSAKSIFDMWEKMILDTASNKGKTKLDIIEKITEEEEFSKLFLYEILERESGLDRKIFYPLHKSIKKINFDIADINKKLKENKNSFIYTLYVKILSKISMR